MYENSLNWVERREQTMCRGNFQTDKFQETSTNNPNRFVNAMKKLQ